MSSNSGIYKIQISDYFYIGQSIDLHGRKSDHLSTLNKGTHRNIHMQRVYNKHKDFKFNTIIPCQVEDLDYWEQCLLDHYFEEGDKHFMNICKDVTSPTRGLKLSEEHKRKISLGKKGTSLSSDHKKKLSLLLKGKNHPMYGKRHSIEAKKKMRESHKGLKSGPKHHRYDHTIYTFIHKDGRTETCTQNVLRSKHDLHHSAVSSMILGKRKSTGGWQIIT